MAKKYLTLEKASRQLGMAPDELVRLRERSQIRGFADRGTWKFKSEDVEEFARSRDAARQNRLVGADVADCRIDLAESEPEPRGA